MIFLDKLINCIQRSKDENNCGKQEIEQLRFSTNDRQNSQGNPEAR